MDLQIGSATNSETSSRKIVAVAPGEFRPSLVDFGRLARPSSLCFTAKEYGEICQQKTIISKKHETKLVKLIYVKDGVQIIKFTEWSQNYLAGDLLSKIHRKIGKSKVNVKFEDNQGDWISLLDDYDLAIANEQSNTLDHGILLLCCHIN
jgi:hypothetical protein